MRITISAAIAASCLTSAAFAGGEFDRNSGPVLSGLTITQDGFSTDFRLTHREFLRLDRRDMQRLANRSNPNRHVLIAGYSPEMSAQLTTMATASRASTFALIRDMQSLRDAEGRLSRLQAEAGDNNTTYQAGIAVWMTRPMDGAPQYAD